MPISLIHALLVVADENSHGFSKRHVSSLGNFLDSGVHDGGVVLVGWTSRRVHFLNKPRLNPLVVVTSARLLLLLLSSLTTIISVTTVFVLFRLI